MCSYSDMESYMTPTSGLFTIKLIQILCWDDVITLTGVMRKWDNQQPFLQIVPFSFTKNAMSTE